MHDGALSHQTISLPLAPLLSPDFMLDLQLRVLQAGSVLRNMLPAMATPGTKISDVLAVSRAKCSSSFERRPQRRAM